MCRLTCLLKCTPTVMCNRLLLGGLFWFRVLALSGPSCEIHRNSLTHEEITDQTGWITSPRSYNSVSSKTQGGRIIEFGLLYHPKYFLNVFYQLVWWWGRGTLSLNSNKVSKYGPQFIISSFFFNSNGTWIRMTVVNQPLCISNLHIFLLRECDFKLHDCCFILGQPLTLFPS